MIITDWRLVRLFFWREGGWRFKESLDVTELTEGGEGGHVMDVTESAEGEGGLKCQGCDRIFIRRRRRFGVSWMWQNLQKEEGGGLECQGCGRICRRRRRRFRVSWMWQNLQKQEKEVQSVRDVTEPAEGGEGGLKCQGCDGICRRRRRRFKV